MSRRLLLQPNVELELAEAVDWYETQSPGLGRDFLMEFDASLARVVENPFQYQIVDEDIRRAPTRRFRYGIMYTASDDELVNLACFHGNRDPKNWRGLRVR